MKDAIPDVIIMLIKIKVNEKDICYRNKLALGGMKNNLQNRIKKELEDRKKLFILVYIIGASSIHKANTNKEES